MSIQRGIYTRVRALQRRHINPDAPMTSPVDLDLAYQTQRMAYVSKVNIKTFQFAGPLAAPQIIGLDDGGSNKINDYGAFMFDAQGTLGATSKTFDIPWVAHPNATKLKALVFVGRSTFDAELRIQMETRTMLTAIATVTSAPAIFPPSQEMAKIGLWNRVQTELTNRHVGPMSYSFAPLTIEPTYPAGKKNTPFLVRFRGGWFKGDKSTSTAASVDRKASILCVRMWDEVDEPNPEA